MKPIAFITGATSGIGEATAKKLASNYFLVLCGRRKDRLDALEKNIRVHTDVHTLCFDVRDRKAVFDAVDSLPPQWQDISLLINNAGNAHGYSLIHEGDMDDWDAMIDINVKGLLYVSRAIIPRMVEKKKGHIVNIGSIAGIEAYLRGNVYNASKFAVNGLTQGMRMDLNPYGIKVSEIKPGLVETEFAQVRFKGDQEMSASVYKGMEPLLARDIADAVDFVVSRPAHVTIADMLVFPTAQASAAMVHRTA
ncbi:MAG: SDR family NAD(P)-dependent oxidoreductase [Cyclobacteriaceae bacterium]|nr:SDR family NAD(P)-dependent oxidoreductase [Cyclobacteriaceae bacterium]